MGLSLNQFNDQAAGIKGMTLKLFSIPDLVSKIFASPLPPDFRVLRARSFSPKDFARLFLSPEEMAQLNGFKVLKKQVEWICGRFAVKSLVSKRLSPLCP